MGIWDTGVFGNDNACDWSLYLETIGMQYVIDAIEKVHLIGPRYLPRRVTEEALAACEVIARLQGSYGKRDAYSEKVDRWVASKSITVLPEIAELAIAVIDRILAGPSEALEIWGLDDDLKSWRANVLDLKKRIEQTRCFYLN